MSGMLLGEVIDAAEAGLLDKLSLPAFSALIAIAEKCNHHTRQGTVRRERIRAAIHRHNSETTAKRAIRELKDAGLIRIVKNGYRATGQEPTAATFELLQLGSPKGGLSSDEEAQATMDGPCYAGSSGQNGPRGCY